MIQPLVKIRDFSGGFTDAFGRGKAPDNTFADSKNLVPTKYGSLETTHGYSTTGGVSSLPTNFTGVGNSGTSFDISSIVAEPFPYSAESPLAYDGHVFWFKDANNAYHIALDYWFKGATRYQKNAENDACNYVLLDERREITPTGVTIAKSAAVYTITITDAVANHNLSPIADYYNGWRLEWYDLSEGAVNSYVYITDYAYTAGSDEATITVKENIGTNGFDWNTTDKMDTADDTLKFRRWFHDPEAFNPEFDTIPGQTFCEDGRVRGCGGASSTENKFPWIAQYINRAFFTGHVSTQTYQGTYVDRAEMVATIAGAAVLSGTAIGTHTSGTAFPNTYKYQVATTLEYDGYQEGPLSSWSSEVEGDGSKNQIYYNITVPWARLNKRITAVNVYAREIIAGVTGQAILVNSHSLVSPTSDELSVWSWDNAGTSTKGKWYLAGAVSNVVSFDYGDWVAAQGNTYFSRTTMPETTLRQMVSWKYTWALNGRRFYANFYDPNEALTLADSVRFTPIFGSGANAYDCIPSDRLGFELDTASGNPDSVVGLRAQNGYLIVFKSNSIHSWYISQYPETFSYTLLSNVDGCYSAKSIVSLPDGTIGFADVDNYKILVNGRVIPVTTLWSNTYYSLTNKSTIIAWYDKIDGTLRITDGVDSTNRYIYACFVGMKGTPWYKLQLPAAQYVEFVYVERDGSVLFTNQYATFQGVFKFHKTDYTYGSSGIEPYLKTNDIIPDENAKVSVDKFVIISGLGCDGGTLENKLFIDGTQVYKSGTTNNWTAQDKTKTHLYQKVPVNATLRMGRKFYIEFNAGSGAMYNSDGRFQLDGIDVYGTVHIPVNVSA